MANESLIEALEQLRAGYAQRLRAANAVLATLKGATGALTKAGRAVNDYAGQIGGEPSASLAQTQAMLGGLRLREEAVDPLAPELRREIRTLTSLATGLRDAATALRAEPVDVVRLGRAVATLQSARTTDGALLPLLADLGVALEDGQRDLSAVFGVGLRDAVARLGLELGGRPPRFEIGRFEVITDFVRRRASLFYGKEELSRTIPLSVEAVIKAYQAEAKAITGRNEDRARWMEQFQAAYQRIQSRRAAGDGQPAQPGPASSRVNIVECYFEVVLLRQSRAFRSAPSKKTFIDYPRAQFIYDFTTLADRRRIQAHTATKNQTDNAERSFWLVEGDRPHEGGYIADIQLV